MALMARNPAGRWCLTILVAALVLVHLLLLADGVSGNPLLKTPMIDAALHHELAIEIAGGRFVSDGPFERPPLYSWFLAALYTLSGTNPVAAALVQALLGLAGLWLLFRLTRLYAGGGAAYFALFLAGLYGPLALFGHKLLPASLSVVILLVLLNLLADWLGKGAWWRIAAAGFAGGLLVLDRPNMVFLPLMVVLWLLVRRAAGSRPGALLFFLALAAGIAPAFCHNIAAGDGSVPVCTGGGLNFYLGNRQGAEISFSSGGEELGDGKLFTDPGGMTAASAAVFVRERGRPPVSGAELERFWIGKGVGEILADPAGWLLLEAGKLRGLLSNFEYGVNSSYSAEKEIVTSLRLFVIPFWVLAALGAAGLFLRGCPVGGREPPSRLPLYLVLAAVALSSLVFFTYSRFRLPAVPVLALLGGDLLARSVAAVRRRRKEGKCAPGMIRVLPPVAACFAVAALSLLPPGTLARGQVAGGHALVGAAFFRDGKIDEACAAYARAVDVDPGAVRALQTWASVLFSAGRFEEARALHGQAIAVEPATAEVLVNAAMFLATVPYPFCDTGRALEFAARAEELDPGLPIVAFSQAVILRLEGRKEESAAKTEEALARSGRAPWMLRMIATWYRKQRMELEARALEAELCSRENSAQNRSVER
jgi:4-amino-4-deoxy-L-arabinose transferase-like glycosyltransferase